MKTKHLIVGKIGPTYGIQGWLKVLSYTEVDTDLLKYTPWLIQDKHPTSWREIAVENGKKHGNYLIAKFVGINTPEEARLLTGKHIAIDRAQLPKLKSNHYYWTDLEGLTVINQRGEVLGIVMYLLATGSNDVLVVKGKKEHAIPYLPKTVILDIDLLEKKILVDWELI